MQPSPTTPASESASADKRTEPSDVARRAQRLKWEKVRRQLERENDRNVRNESARSVASAAIHVEEVKRRYWELEGKYEALQSQLARSEDKIHRMQNSASWRMTAPLRTVRRAIEGDGVPKGASSSAPATDQPIPRFLWSLDQPLDWNAAPSVGPIRGWFVWLPEGLPASTIRIHFGDKVLPARMELPREDVVAVHAFNPGISLKCGFHVDYRLDADRDYPLLFEVQAPDGRWIPFEKRTLKTSNQPQTVRDYGAWVEAFGRIDREKRAALRNRIALLPESKRPLISVLMPVYDTPERWLSRAIESVRDQVYENWELCIADDASPAPHVRPLLERFAAMDPRIRICFRSENGHISQASNSALELVRGDFVALLDHDDEIPPDALAEVILHLAAHPDADLVYSDEDKLDEEGRRTLPYFKADFLPDLLTGQNCCSHLSVYRTALVKEVGGFRTGFEGSQDWDLALRVTERTTPAQVQHIPKILYHWRMVKGSTSCDVSEKSYSVDAARRALAEHFARQGINVGLTQVPGSHWRVLHPLPEPRPLVSIIIPSHNAAPLLRMCVASLLSRTDYEPLEVIVVNNRSDAPEALALLDELGREPGVRVLDFDAPFNYSAINNFAVKQARGDIVCLLNNDIEIISRDWLSEMVSHAVRPGIGAVGAMLYYPDMTIQHAGVILGLGGVANHIFIHEPSGTAGYMNRARLVQNYSAVTGACLVVRRSLYEQMGGLDEVNLAVAFNDIDFVCGS
ncbi:MAG: glycosyltransferase, partial [Opitutaceae bacterium]